mmetsp:Transcript_35968/g.73254  ORF Transcript_35968/g.73254 Transcript_35968/m.73254 type:complete len:81 (-) Transcript_35968:39-281(-)
MQKSNCGGKKTVCSLSAGPVGPFFAGPPDSLDSGGGGARKEGVRKSTWPEAPPEAFSAPDPSGRGGEKILGPGGRYCTGN